MDVKKQVRNSTVDFLVFTKQNGEDGIEVRVHDEDVWLTQKSMAQLFDCSTDNIGLHLKNIFASGELDAEAVTEKSSATASDGKKYRMKFYNLDAIISVGYRINSIRATQFRQWATKILKTFTVQGYVLDKKRLENGQIFDEEYFEHLLDEIREIRASERKFYQKITDIYATAVDYSPTAAVSRDFFAMVQNKLHYAIHRHTAAEVIVERADHRKEYMGLTTWKNAPEGRILKSDVTVAKNYLSEQKIRQLERTVTGYFDYIEDLIERENTFTMEEFAASVNEFLSFRRYDILRDKGKVSRKQAQEKAEQEYDLFNKTQKIESDFDKEVKKLLKTPQ